MRLDRLIDGLDVIDAPAGAGTVEVDSVTHDSRAVAPGALFCCVPGGAFDGHDFAAAAVAAGATALLVEHHLAVDRPQVVVPSVRRAMPLAAAAVLGHPSRALTVVGVTGTNGKTTVTHMLRSALEAGGRPTGVIGTIGGRRTTPEGPELQAMLAGFVDGGIPAVAIEVSSHALEQHRVDGIRFAAAVFTNLSQDHLDFHRTMDAYFGAKARLFETGRTELAVINADDPWGLRLTAMVRVPVCTYSMADASDLTTSLAGSSFVWRGEQVRLPLAGRLNVSNALAAATTASALGVPAGEVAAGLSALAGVPGRFERVDAGQPFAVVVDYAHTPDGLEHALAAARDLVAGGGGRLLVVFGCGGDRDRAKRPLMGEIATRLADRAYLTNDNPRSEDPMAIIDAVRHGVNEMERLVIEPDRAQAIAIAFSEADAGDMVLIAGKGHETGQEVDGVVTAFDDRIVARQLLEHM